MVENPPRFVREGSGLSLRLRLGSWPIPAVFPLIASAGVDEHEMRRVFNMGLGMIVAVAQKDAAAALATLQAAGHAAFVVGDVTVGREDIVEFY